MLNKIFAASLVALVVATAAESARAQVFLDTPNVKAKVEPTFWNPNPQDGTPIDVYPQVWVGGGRRGFGPGGPGGVGPGVLGPVGYGPTSPGGIGGRPGLGFGAGTPFRPLSGRGFGRR